MTFLSRSIVAVFKLLLPIIKGMYTKLWTEDGKESLFKDDIFSKVSITVR